MTDTTKPPVNRKVALYVVTMLGAAAMIAVLIGITGHNPQKQRVEAQQAAALAADKALPAGTRDEGVQAVQNKLHSFDTDTLYSKPIVPGQGVSAFGAGKKADGSLAGMPSVDASTLAALQQAADATRKPGQGLPSTASGIGNPAGLGTAGLAASGTPAAKPSSTYENYPDKHSMMMTPAQATGLESNNDSAAATAQGGQPHSDTYAAVRPLRAPDGQILTKGTLLRAVLDTQIDTRNAGDATATITQDVYDSLDQSKRLVPKGSRLLGTYATNVSPGLPRIPVTFSRLQLPDGRIIDLGKTNALNYAGATGIDGTYHSNILRALGPSLVVALIGTAVDNMQNKRASATTGMGTTVQSPSVAEQMAPQVNSEVMTRYAAAKPYFIVKTGTQFKIALQGDVVIPGGAAPQYPTTNSLPASTAVAAPAPDEDVGTVGSGSWTAGNRDE